MVNSDNLRHKHHLLSFNRHLCISFFSHVLSSCALSDPLYILPSSFWNSQHTRKIIFHPSFGSFPGAPFYHVLTRGKLILPYHCYHSPDVLAIDSISKDRVKERCWKPFWPKSSHFLPHLCYLPSVFTFEPSLLLPVIHWYIWNSG